MVHSRRRQNFVIRRIQTLAYTLELLTKETDGLFQHAIIQGQLAIYPDKPVCTVYYPEMRADFTADNISTWEAIKRLVMQSNETCPEGSGIEVSDFFTMQLSPPDEFTTAPVSVHTRNSTLRETLCVILSASPLRVSLLYRHCRPGDPGMLTLRFPDMESKPYRTETRPLLGNSPELTQFWMREHEEISDARKAGITLNEVPTQGAK